MIDILNQLIQFYLNNALNLRPLTQHIIPCYRGLPTKGWLGNRAVSVLDSDAKGPGFKTQLRRCEVTVLGIVPLSTKQRNW